MLNKVKHLAIAREILRCAQNDIVHHLTCDRALVVRDYYSTIFYSGKRIGGALRLCSGQASSTLQYLYLLTDLSVKDTIPATLGNPQINLGAKHNRFKVLENG
jgi:hypothetical protein